MGGRASPHAAVAGWRHPVAPRAVQAALRRSREQGAERRAVVDGPGQRIVGPCAARGAGYPRHFVCNDAPAEGVLPAALRLGLAMPGRVAGFSPVRCRAGTRSRLRCCRRGHLAGAGRSASRRLCPCGAPAAAGVRRRTRVGRGDSPSPRAIAAFPQPFGAAVQATPTLIMPQWAKAAVPVLNSWALMAASNFRRCSSPAVLHGLTRDCGSSWTWPPEVALTPKTMPLSVVRANPSPFRVPAGSARRTPGLATHPVVPAHPAAARRVRP